MANRRVNRKEAVSGRGLWEGARVFGELGTWSKETEEGSTRRQWGACHSRALWRMERILVCTLEMRISGRVVHWRVTRYDLCVENIL